MVSDKVILESLESSASRDAEIAGREFVPKQSKSCNCLAWNPIESNILIAGLDKYRGDNCLLIWDITRPMYLSSALDAVSTFERRSVFQLDPSTVSKPVAEFAPSESIQSVQWFPNNSKLFVCGVNGKHLRLYDTRDTSKNRESTFSKAVYNLCIDRLVEHRIASSYDNSFSLWDVRNFKKPVATMNEPKQILKLCWSPTRPGLLAILGKDSSTINLYDIQSPAINDEVEPPIVERNLQPFASHPIMSFSWHPTQENRLLTISQNSQILDYTVFDRIALNWSPTSEIVWTCGRKILQCVDSRDDFYSCLDGISVKMRKRACHGYGLKMPKIWMNAELADDPNLDGVWMWLDFVKAAESEWKRRSNPRNQPKYEGVYNVICGENGHSVINASESVSSTWNGINTVHCRISKYVNEERKRALQICGWSKDSDSMGLVKFLERLENDGHFVQASAIALFNLELHKAIEILSKGACSKNYKGNADLNAIAMALAGYTDDKSALWREISCSLKKQLNDPYLRAMFAFLTTEDANYDEILNEDQIAVQDRMAFACLYLDDRKLVDFLDSLKKRMSEIGNLDGILLTGLTNDGPSLIQRYVDTTGDVQTASLIVLHSLLSKTCEDSRAQGWVNCYRNLLDTWKLWKPSIQEVQCFTFENLPDIIRAKTPKVTIYGKDAKCVMMENSPCPDYELNSYDGYHITEIGDKITVMDQNCIQLTDEKKRDPHVEFLLNTFKSMKEKCFKIEAYLEYLSKACDSLRNTCFPVIVGRRPNPLLRNLDDSKENASPRSINSSTLNRTVAMKSYSGTINTDCSPSTNSSPASISSPLSNRKGITAEKNINDIVPALKGQPMVVKEWVIADYEDGVQMWISINERDDVFFLDRDTKQRLSNEHPELMKRYHKHLSSVLRYALSEEVKKTT